MSTFSFLTNTFFIQFKSTWKCPSEQHMPPVLLTFTLQSQRFYRTAAPPQHRNTHSCCLHVILFSCDNRSHSGKQRLSQYILCSTFSQFSSQVHSLQYIPATWWKNSLVIKWSEIQIMSEIECCHFLSHSVIQYHYRINFLFILVLKMAKSFWRLMICLLLFWWRHYSLSLTLWKNAIKQCNGMCNDVETQM